jgi:hypothetical protein
MYSATTFSRIPGRRICVVAILLLTVMPVLSERAIAGEVVLHCDPVSSRPDSRVADGAGGRQLISLQPRISTAAEIVTSVAGKSVPCKLGPSHVFVELRGSIDGRQADTVEALARILTAQERIQWSLDQAGSAAWVFLESDGGDLSAAMRIGRTLRNLNATVWIRRGSRCRSACVLMLAAGARREVSGEVGVHRPYFGDLPPRLSASGAAKLVRDLDSSILAYLDEMNVPRALLDRMKAVPPETMHRLSPDELGRFMLTGSDPVYDERVVARLAHTYGVTSAEYRKRDAVANRFCPPMASDAESFTRFTNCYYATLYGISEAMYAERRSRADHCSLGAPEDEKLSARELTQLLECVRKAMLNKH